VRQWDSLLERAKALEIALGICSTNLSEARDDIDNMSLNSRRRLKKARAIWLFYTDKLILEQEQEYFRHASVLDKEKKRMDRTQEFLRAKVVRIESLENGEIWLMWSSGALGSSFLLVLGFYVHLHRHVSRELKDISILTLKPSAR